MKSDTSEERDLLRLMFTQKYQYLFGLIAFQLAEPRRGDLAETVAEAAFSGFLFWQLPFTVN